MAKKETDTSGSKKKRYYFLKLPADHHKTPMMERLIHRLGNEGYGLYLRLLEMTVSNTGFLKFDHVENTIEEQAAFDLKITDDQARELIGTLEKLGLVERIEENPEEDDPGGLLFKEGALYTADETPEAARQRLYRERHKIPPNEPESGQALQCNGEVLQSDDNKNKSKKENKNLEKDVDTDIHLSLENSYSLKEESGGAACGGAAGAAPAPPASSSSSSFLDKIRELNGKKKKNRLSEAGLAAFAAETKEGAELWGKPIEGGLSKALNSWAKKTAEKGKHPEFFDDGAGQNAAALDGAGQDHAGQNHAEQDGTSAGPGKAAPDQGGGDQAASTTTAQDEAKEKQLKAEKEQAEQEAEALKKKLEEAEQAAKIAQQQAEQREKALKDEAEKADRERRKLKEFHDKIEWYSEVCRGIEKLPKDNLFPCIGGTDNCKKCPTQNDCLPAAYAALKKLDGTAYSIFGAEAMPYLMARPTFALGSEGEICLRQISGISFHPEYVWECGEDGHVQFQEYHGNPFNPETCDKFFLDNPFKGREEEFKKKPELLKKYHDYYHGRPYYGVPEAIARKELKMPLPFEVEESNKSEGGST